MAGSTRQSTGRLQSAKGRRPKSGRSRDVRREREAIATPRRRRSGSVRNLGEYLVPVLYEDEDMLVVNKPAGIDAGGRSDAPSTGLAEIMAGMHGRDEPYQVANRLSRYESGILVLAKNGEMARHIRTGLRMQRIAQVYSAVVVGRLRSHQRVIASDGPKPGRHAPPTQRPIHHKVTGKGIRAGRADDSATVVRALHRGNGRLLVECHTHAPTTHALRARLRGARLRLLGDRLKDPLQRRGGQSNAHLHLSRMSVFHPRLKTKLVLRCRTPASFEHLTEGGADVIRPLHAALVRRLELLSSRETDAHRLLAAGFEDVPGLVVDRYGPVIMLEVTQDRPALVAALDDVAGWYQATLDAQAIYVRHNLKGGPASGGGSSERAVLLRGKAVPEPLVVTERGLRFSVAPSASRSAGLFADHRDNRHRIRRLARGQDVLNLFAYTCGFSVAAAAGGAHGVVSVDLSNPHLEWGKRNFELNRLPIDNAEFILSDAASYLRRARRAGLAFDVVIVDPPTFSHGRRRNQSFSVARDLVGLLQGAVGVLRRGGTVMVAVNLRSLSVGALRELVRRAAGGRRHRIIETARLPVDFAVDPDHQKTMLVGFDESA